MYPKAYYDKWSLDLVAFFMEKYNYQMVSIIGIDYGVWLFNTNNSYAPLILITPLSFKAIGKEHIEKRRNEISALLKIENKGVNISVVPLIDHVDDENIVISLHTKTPSKAYEKFKGLDEVVQPIKDTNETSVLFKSSFKPKTLRSTRSIFWKVMTPLIFLTFMISQMMLMMGFSRDIIGLLLGGYYKNLVVLHNDWFRLISNGFAITSPWTLILAFTLSTQLNAIIKSSISTKKYISLFMLGILSGSIMAYIGNYDGVMLGLINGFLAIFGYYLAGYVQKRLYLIPKTLTPLVYITLTFLLWMVVPNNNPIGNAFAVLIGFALGVLANKNPENIFNRNLIVFGFSALSVVLIYLMYTRTSYLVGGSLYNEYIDLISGLGR